MASVERQREYRRRWEEKNPGHRKRYYAKNRLAVLARQELYRAANLKKKRLMDVRYHRNHATEIRKRQVERRRRTISFKGRPRVVNHTVGYTVRTGRCAECGRRVGIDVKRTGMHHFYYDPAHPLAGTIELCAACHVKKHKPWERFNMVVRRSVQKKEHHA